LSGVDGGLKITSWRYNNRGSAGHTREQNQERQRK
jgi:hypothetical protein